MKFSLRTDWISSAVRRMHDPAAARAELSEQEQRRIKTFDESLIVLPGSAALVLLLPYALGLPAAAVLLFLWFLRVDRRNARARGEENAAVQDRRIRE